MIVGVRHAKVRNPDGLVYARLPGFGLSEDGRAEAMELARLLAAAPIAAVWASPLERAQETAAILSAPHGLAVQTDDRLVEWSFWVRWQGMVWMRIRERAPQLLDVYANDPAAANPGDTLGDVGARVLEWAAEAEAAAPAGLVVGVTHEAPLQAACFVGSGRPLSEFHAMHLPHLGMVRLRPGLEEGIDAAALVRGR